MALAEVKTEGARRVGVGQEVALRIGQEHLRASPVAGRRDGQSSSQVDGDGDHAEHPAGVGVHGGCVADGRAVRQFELVVFPVEADVRHEHIAFAHTQRFAKENHGAVFLQLVFRFGHHRLTLAFHAHQLASVVGHADKTHLMRVGSGDEIGRKDLQHPLLPLGLGGSSLPVHAAVFDGAHQPLHRRCGGQKQQAAPPLGVFAFRSSGEGIHRDLQRLFGLLVLQLKLLAVAETGQQQRHHAEAQASPQGQRAAQEGGGRDVLLTRLPVPLPRLAPQTAALQQQEQAGSQQAAQCNARQHRQARQHHA